MLFSKQLKKSHKKWIKKITKCWRIRKKNVKKVLKNQENQCQLRKLELIS